MSAYARSRSRSIPNKYTMYTSTDYSTGISHASIGSFTNSEYCSDEIHSRFPHEGGPFCVRKVVYSPGVVGGRSSSTYESTKNGTKGGTVCDGFTIYVPSAPTSLPTQVACENSAKEFGASAWKRYAPHPHSISLAESFFELKETFKSTLSVAKALRRIHVTARKPNRLNDLASGYLGLEFGWKPFVSDLIKLLNSIKRIDEQIASAQRLNNRWVNRSGSMLETSTKLGVTPISITPHVAPSNYTTDHKSIVTTVKEERVWFKGRFRYFVPALQDDRYIGKVEAIPIIWDINLSPYNLWQLVPWSWLLDWFSNTGDIVYNMSQIATHNLVAKYAYLMRSTETKAERFATWTAKNTHRVDGKGETQYTPMGGVSSTSVITKTRVAASPFGFNLSLPDLSDWQVSILIALGLART